MKIGLFDSGLGGLTILKALRGELPNYDYEYYGDTQHIPYGERCEREITELTRQGVEHLFARDCGLVIIACNSASVETLRTLQDTILTTYFDRKILGVVIPVVEQVVASHCQRILLLATNRTVSSGKYQYELGKRQVENIKIESVAMTELVPLIEAGKVAAACALIEEVIEQRRGDIDGIILGCTHYTLLKDRLRVSYGDELTVFSQDEIIPMSLQQYLATHPELETRLSQTGTRILHLTQPNDHYVEIAEEILHRA